MMKTTMMTLAFGLLVTSGAFAGAGGSNGGGIHFCPGKKSEMYDIYEGHNRYNYVFTKNPTATVDAHLNRALEKIKGSSPRIHKMIQNELSYLKNGHFLIRPNLVIPPIADATLFGVDEGCSYKQLANWDEISGNVLVKGNYFNLLDNLNKAALYLHEATYEVARKLSYRIHWGPLGNSDEVRPMVAELLSEKKIVTSGLLQGWTNFFSAVGQCSLQEWKDLREKFSEEYEDRAVVRELTSQLSVAVTQQNSERISKLQSELKALYVKIIEAQPEFEFRATTICEDYFPENE